jgi:amino acid transporter
MAAPTLRREAGIGGLIFACLGAMIGSGWLFGPLHAAQMAGPWSLLAWVFGAIACLLLAFVYAELATFLPVSGAAVHFPRLSHGEFLARTFGFVNFLSYIIVGPIEAMAVLSYLNNIHPGLTDAHGVLTSLGFALSFLMLALFTLVNFLAIRLVLSINNTLMYWKIAIPVGVALILPLYAFHPQNLTVAPAHDALLGILQATATSGAVFSYLGFRQAVELAGETANPLRTIPRALIGSVLIAAVIYLGLQAAFLFALDPHMLATHGWQDLTFPGMAGPFAGLASSLGAAALAMLLYVDAFVSPGGTGFIYQTTAMRIILALTEAGQLPRFFGKLNRAGVPWAAGLLSFFAGALFLLPFPSWQKLVGAVSSIAILAYSTGPIALIVLRRQQPLADDRHVYRLPAAGILAPVTFIISNLLIYWTGFKTVSFLLGVVTAAMLLYLAHYLLIRRLPVRNLHLHRAWWIVPWYAGLWLITWLGDPMVHGRGVLPFPWDFAAIVVLSLTVIGLAVRTASPKEDILAYMAELGAIEETSRTAPVTSP